MATIVVTASGSAPPPAQPSDTKICSQCQRGKPVEDYVKPGTTESLRTCTACRQRRAASRARHSTGGAKRKRKSRTIGDPPQSRRKTENTEHTPGRALSSTSPKQAVQNQHSSSPLSSPSSHSSPSPQPLPNAGPQAAPPPPTPLSASSDSGRVRTDTVNFAASLARLAQLVSSATNVLGDERLVALAEEIHHDWKVDEMATFVDGFLKGAAGPGQDRASW